MIALMMTIIIKKETRLMEMKVLYKKHQILTDGLQRLYVQSVSDRRLDMTGVTPVELIVYFSDTWGGRFVYKNSSETLNTKTYHFRERSWSGLLTKLVNFLQESNPKTNEELLSLTLSWSNAKLFRETKDIANSVKLENGLYFSFNYSAVHSSWVIDELLKAYGVYCGDLIVHRPSFSEPKEVVDAIKELRMNQFCDYLIHEKRLDEAKADTIVNAINGPLNKLLSKKNSYNNDFFVFDDAIALANYKSKVVADLPYVTKWNEKQIKTAKKYLDYLTDFYTTLKLEAKNHKNDLLYRVKTIQ